MANNYGTAKLRDTALNAKCSDRNIGKLLRKYIQYCQPQAKDVWLEGAELRQIQEHILECRACRELYIGEVEGLQAEVAEFTEAFFNAMEEDSEETEEPARQRFILIKNNAR